MAKIFCKRTNEEADRMEKCPYPGPHADLIMDNVSQKAWDEWIEASLILLNEYRLNLLDSKHAEYYEQQMLAFLNLSDDPNVTQANLVPPEPPKG